MDEQIEEIYEQIKYGTGSYDCDARSVAEIIIEQMGYRKQREWVSVEERLPEPETDVIAFVGDYIDILSYRYDRRGSLAFMYKDDSGWWHERIRPSVTHWMPLPEPPKGGAE